MCELGNTVINQIYEGACEELGAKKPGLSSSRFVYLFIYFTDQSLLLKKVQIRESFVIFVITSI